MTAHSATAESVHAKADLDALKISLLAEISATDSLDQLEDVRVRALGKKGVITDHMKQLGKLDGEARKAQGQALNQVKDEVMRSLEAHKKDLQKQALNARLASEEIDVTLPVRRDAPPATEGRVHPITQTIEEITAIFTAMGFRVATGPDVEDDFHNFTALNIPPEHPARQMHDTFYLPNDTSGDGDGSPRMLRTQTSNVQIRTMQSQKPPIQIIAPGRTYRSDSDQTHTPMFHQIEGLMIDETTNFGHLKGCLMDFCQRFFGIKDLPVRFRPSHFPFTEPSAEMDIACHRDKDRLILGEGDDWLEVLGCGMVHPKVLQNCGVDSEKYQGFAFGMGVERLAMLKYGIPDLRTFFEADVRWLQHYGFLFHEQPGGVASLSPRNGGGSS